MKKLAKTVMIGLVILLVVVAFSGASLAGTSGGDPGNGYIWTIDKTADQTELTLEVGQQYPVNYRILVEASEADGAATVNDECVNVSDTNVGDLGMVCADTTPTVFRYRLNIGPFDVCGDYNHPNMAYLSNSKTVIAKDSWNVKIKVPCEGGCTLTPGYWKTHSRYGPAPYDATWVQIGEDTPFFGSGKSYYEVLWTPPKGNAYYILAFQYIAAELNFLNGVNPSAAQAAFDEAAALFAQHTPDEIAELKGRSKKVWTDLATTLDRYNDGMIGPGHCTD